MNRLAVAAGVAVIALSGSQRPLDAQQISKSVRDGVYSEEQAARGKALFNEHCAGCHGVVLNGTDAAPALVGGPFMSNWSGLSVGDLAGRVRTTMPANDPGSLSGRTVADIMSYLLKANGFPAGTVELPREAAILGQIRIVPAPESKQ
jgi:mono/diheme cytochrome c family protein